MPGAGRAPLAVQMRAASEQGFPSGQRRVEGLPLGFELGHPPLELQYPPNRSERHSLVDQADDVLDASDLHPGIAPLPPCGPRRPDHLELVEAAQERLLDIEHGSHLPDREQRRVLIVNW